MQFSFLPEVSRPGLRGPDSNDDYNAVRIHEGPTVDRMRKRGGYSQIGSWRLLLIQLSDQ